MILKLTLALFVLLTYGEVDGVLWIIMVATMQMRQKGHSIISPPYGAEVTNKFLFSTLCQYLGNRDLK